MSAARKLQVVPEFPVEKPAPDVSYEHRERKRIAERDWAAVHIRGDRAAPLNIIDRVTRLWR